MTTECPHSHFEYIVPGKSKEFVDRTIGLNGFWECILCRNQLSSVMGHGFCRSCGQAIDDHEHFMEDGTPRAAGPICRRRR